MKRYLILLVMLCLLVSTVFVMSCGGNTDTDTSTDTTTDTDTNVDTSTDTGNVVVEKTYVITLKDQEGDAIANAKISIVDKDDTYAYAIFNLGEKEENIEITAENSTLRDLWAKENISSSDKTPLTIPPHTTRILKSTKRAVFN